MKQSIVAAGAGQAYDWSSDQITVKTPMNVTDGRVTVVEDRLKPGFHLPRHHYRTMAEIFYVIEGEVVFRFDDQVLAASTGMTVNVPPGVWHEVTSERGARLVTIFSPGGFDQYLAELAALPAAELADESAVAALGERFDLWTR